MLTGFAVVLGVAFVAGTFIFTDTIDASFKDLFERTSKGTDVSVQSKLAVEADFAAPPTMPADTLERVQSVDGVEEAAGSVSADVNLLDREGKPILSNGPPTIAVTTVPERFDPLTYVEGDKPTSDDQIAIDKGTADEFGYKVGDKVDGRRARAREGTTTVSGIATLGDSENLAGSRLVVFTLPEAQQVTGHDGYDDISVGRRRRHLAGAAQGRDRARAGQASSPCAPARSRPRSRRRTSPTRSASSARRCSCSPPSRCSWAAS